MAYKQPYHYIEAELRQAEIDDLITDYRCALRDNLPDYAARVSDKLAAMGVDVRHVREGRD